MLITLSPIAASFTSSVSLNGLILTVDGTDYDLSVIPEGGQADAAPDSPFIGTVTRESVTIKYCYDSSIAEPNQSLDIADYIFEMTSGVVPSPIQWRA